MAFERLLCEVLGLEVIITDIDDTLVAVGNRAVESLRQLDIEATPEDWEEKLDALKQKAKQSQEDRDKVSQFFKMFLDDAFTHLDAPHRAIYDFIRILASKSSLPVVAVSGRPEKMINSAMKVLKGIPLTDIILKPEGQRMLKAPEYKVDAIKRKNYIPKFVIDNEPTVLDAIGKEWPDAVLYKAHNGSIIPYFSKDQT
jgi:hypothetical protein